MDTADTDQTAPLERLAVFIHGAGGGAWEWRQWAPDFERAGWKCIFRDLEPRQSGLEATEFSFYLRQVVGWAKERQPYRLVLIGASMGGILALKAQEEVHTDAVVLVNSVGTSVTGSGMIAVWPDIIPWSSGTLDETSSSMPDSDTATIHLAHENWRDESGLVLRELAAGIQISPPRCPLLVIVGDQDTEIPYTVGMEIANNFKGDLRVYRGMSHLGPLLGTRAIQVALDTTIWLDENVR